MDPKLSQFRGPLVLPKIIMDLMGIASYNTCLLFLESMFLKRNFAMYKNIFELLLKVCCLLAYYDFIINAFICEKRQYGLTCIQDFIE